MARVEVILSGSPISDTRASLAKDQILPGDLFYISQQQLSNVSPDRAYDSGTAIYTNQFKSAKMSYDTLSSMMLERFREHADFGTMAWESSSDYSLAQHIHNYSKVEMSSHNNPTDDEGQMLSIASFQIDHTAKKVLWMAKPREYRMPEPSIGQLKFLALTSIPDVDEAASGFDGWTWPDGRTVQNTNGRFARAAAYFGDGANAPEFTLPALGDFIRPARLSDADSQLGTEQAQNNLLVQHQHGISDIKLKGDAALTCPVTFWRSKGNSAGDACHGARNETDYYLKVGAVFNASNLVINGQISEEEQSGETYPTHNLLPVMIYIGRPSS